MTDKLYLITEAQRDIVNAAISMGVLVIENGTDAEHDAFNAGFKVLQSLPMVDSEPVGKVLNRGKKILHTGWLNDVGLKLPDNTPLYTLHHPKPLQP